MMKRWKKRTWLVLIVLLVVIIFPPVRPIDRSDFHESDHFRAQQAEWPRLTAPAVDAGHRLEVGFGKENITPYRIPTAGYGQRRGKLFSYVHDSVFVRTLVLRQGDTKVAVVSADMLIIPPVITELLAERLPTIGYSLDNTYLGATHTHNSIGTWGKRLIGVVYSGSYSDSVVNFVTDKIVASIRAAELNLVQTSVRAGEIAVPEAVYNRMDEKSTVDPLLRVMEFVRDDSTRLLLTSYTAHATCLDSEELALSRDYPGKLVDTFEKNGYDFAMFMAGAVGSHGPTAKAGWEGVDWMAEKISSAFYANRHQLQPVDASALGMRRVPLHLSDPQFKVSRDWCVAPYVFRTLLGEYPVTLNSLNIGSVLMLSAPCDFSGSLMRPLDSLAHTQGQQLMVTSFNGGYVGYITCDQYYDLDYHETRIMNWYGPGNGAYFSGCFEEMIHRLPLSARAAR